LPEAAHPVSPLFKPGKNMQLSELLIQLAQHPIAELVFEFPHGPIRKGYHLTEVLRLRVDAVDCGGALDRWSETVLQLVEPAAHDGTGFMRADKALDILTRTQERVALVADSEVLLEFQSADTTATSAAQRFHIDRMEAVDGVLKVFTRGTSTQCKAAERSQTVCGAKTQASSCCAPPTASATTNRAALVSANAPRCCA
jgi:hypothetical protein